MQKEIRDLKQELRLHDTLASKGVNASTEPYTAEQQYELQKVARDFLQGKTEDIDDLTSMRQVNELLAQMRNAFLKMKQDSAQLLEFDQGANSEKVGTAEENIKRRKTILEDGVGDLDEIGEFGLGTAVREAKPVSKIELSKAKEAEIQQMEKWEEYVEVDYD